MHAQMLPLTTMRDSHASFQMCVIIKLPSFELACEFRTLIYAYHLNKWLILDTRSISL